MATLSEILENLARGAGRGAINLPMDIAWLSAMATGQGAQADKAQEWYQKNVTDRLIEPRGGVAETVGEFLGPPTKTAGKLAATTLPLVVGMARKAGKGGTIADALKASQELKPMPEMAERYPQQLNPVSAFDPKKNKGKGEYFAAKNNSEEAAQVEALRKRAQAEINAGDPAYQPYFDVSKRADVDEVNYPRTGGDTLTDALPKTQKTIDQWREMYDTPTVRRRLLDAYIRGKGDEGAHDWYAMRQLEEAFVKELGPEAGRAAFKERFADAMANTTGGAAPDDNLLMAAWTNYMRESGQPIPKNRDGSIATFDVPYPVGGRYAASNLKLADRGKPLEAFDQPKRYNFSGNFMGRKSSATIDEQMMSLFEDPDAQRFKDAYAEYAKGTKNPVAFEKWWAKNREMAPPGNSYGVLESILADVAKQVGVDPMNFQEVAWRGAKGGKGHPMIEEVNQMLHRTSKVTGKSQDEVLSGFIRANMPMYGMGAGAIGLPFLLGGGQEEQY